MSRNRRREAAMSKSYQDHRNAKPLEHRDDETQRALKVNATLKLKVVPGASRSEIVGWLGDALKIKVAAAPEKGKANDAVEKLLCKALQLPRGSVQIVAGQTSQQKLVAIDSMTLEEVKAMLP